MTTILSLPELSIPCTIRTNEDWNDAVAFYDVNGNPFPLDGIDFELQARASAASGDVLLDASIANGLLKLCSSCALAQPVTPGAGYAIGDTYQLAGGTFSIPATLTVTALALVGITIVAGGLNFEAGDTIVLTGGVFSSPAVLTVASIGQNGLLGAVRVSSAGSFTVTPTTPTMISTSGAGYGATFSTPQWGVAAARMTSAGTYLELPANPVAQGSSSGLGAGATFDLTWVNNALCIAIPVASITDYLIISAAVYEIRATDGEYTQVVITGPLTVVQGITR